MLDDQLVRKTRNPFSTSPKKSTQVFWSSAAMINGEIGRHPLFRDPSGSFFFLYFNSIGGVFWEGGSKFQISGI